MSVRLRRHSVLAFLSSILIVSAGHKAAAQVTTPPGVVTNRQGVDVNGRAVHRYPIVAMASATQSRVRELIAAHHPGALSDSSAIGEVTFVLGPNRGYVNSTARPASSEKTPAQINGGVAFLPSEPRSLEYVTFAAGEVGPKPLRVIVVNVM
jgi:hypothetical protein